jgi:hypothetical protein
MERTLSRYLRLATWGLPKKKKLEIQQELLGNIEILSLEYQVQGMNKTEALQAALLDFGKPERVCAGMTKVYIMPIILRNLGLAALLSSLGIGILSSSTAQIIASVTGRLPINTCNDGQTDAVEIGKAWIPCEGNYGVWIHLPSLKASLEPLGVKVTTNTKNPWLETTFNFPDAKKPLVIKHKDNQNLPVQNEQVKVSPGYVRAIDFFEKLNSIGLPITLSGWNTTKIGVGNTKFQLNSTNNTVSSEMLYFSALKNIFWRDLETTKSSDSLYTVRNWEQHTLSGAAYPHQISVRNVNPENILVIVSREKMLMQNNDLVTMRVYRISRPNSAREIQFYSRSDTINFLKKDFSALKPDEVINTSEIIVKKFTNRLDKNSFEIIPAKDIRILTK